MTDAKPSRHPELKRGEVFLQNFYLGISRAMDIGWQSRRFGTTAYRKDGTVIQNARPIFVLREELVRKGVDPDKLPEQVDLDLTGLDDDPDD